MEYVQSKRCIKCQIDKLLKDFYGRKSICKACVKQYVASSPPQLRLCKICNERPAYRRLTTCNVCKSRIKRQKRRDSLQLGQCVEAYCKQPAKSGCKHCQHHLSMSSKSTLKTVAQHKSDGNCGCGRKPEENHKMCKICLGKVKAKADINKQAGKCRCGRERRPNLTTCQRCGDIVKKCNFNLKSEIMGYYGGKCALCDVSELAFLTIDHINGGGNKHRTEIFGIKRRGGSSFYSWLKQNDYPMDYQVLCWNHNCEVDRQLITSEQKLTWKYKLNAIAGYGDKCVCCGHNNINHLTIDHIYGGGTKHRKQIGYNSQSFYKWIINNNYPEICQILCFNCNCGRMVNGGVCPHKINSILIGDANGCF